MTQAESAKCDASGTSTVGAFTVSTRPGQQVVCALPKGHPHGHVFVAVEPDENGDVLIWQEVR